MPKTEKGWLLDDRMPIFRADGSVWIPGKGEQPPPDKPDKKPKKPGGK